MTKLLKRDIKLVEDLANKGLTMAQTLIGKSYLYGKFVAPDTKKGLIYLEKAARHLDPEAFVVLGWAYADGQGVETDYAKAIDYWSIAFDLGETEVCGMILDIYLDVENKLCDLKKGYEWLQKGIRAGNAYAYFCYSFYLRAHEEGSEELFAYWMRKAAYAGEVRAMVSIAMMYEGSLGLRENPERACYWYQKAAQAGSLDALYHLGRCYYYGIGMRKNLTKAKTSFKAALKGENPSAMNALGYLALHSANEKRRAQALDYFQEARRLGSREATLNLASLYFWGDLVEKDYAKARDLFFEVCKSTDDELETIANHFLAVMAFEGWGLEDLEIQAMEFFQKHPANECFATPFVPDIKDLYQARQAERERLAEEGNPADQYTLGNCYELGLSGFEKNPQKAVFWFEKSVTQGYRLAYNALATYYASGEGGVQKDLSRALELYRDAIKAGDESALMNLAYLCLEHFSPEGVEVSWSLYHLAIKKMPQAQEAIEKDIRELEKKLKGNIPKKRLSQTRILNWLQARINELREKGKR